MKAIHVALLFVGITLFTGVANAVSVDSYVNARALRRQYSYLYQMDVQTQSDGSLKFDKARLFHKNGINVLSLKGDAFEMAFQDATLLKDQIVNGSALIQTSQIIPNAIQNNYGENPLIARVIKRYIDKHIGQEIVDAWYQNRPDQMIQFVGQAFAISEASGLSVDQIFDAFIAPDAYMVLAQMSSQGQLPGSYKNLAGNCSSFSAWGDYTPDKQLIMGRNLDFPITGAFDRYPTVIYFEPTPDLGQKIMSVTSSGAHLPSLTGLNESGIYLAAHTLPTTNVNVEGGLVFSTVMQVLLKAHTFDEAVAIFRANPLPVSGWIYDLISTKEIRVASVELNNSTIAIRESTGGFHIQTNHGFDPNIVKQTLFVNHNVDEDSHARYDRVAQLIEQNHGTIDKFTIAKILGDQFDPYLKAERGVGNTVAVHETVSSVITIPKDKQVYVAIGAAPVSRNSYQSFPFPETFDPNTFLSLPSAVIDVNTFATDYQGMAKAESIFIQAKEAFEYSNDSEKAFQLMQQVVSIDPTNPHYYFVLGILGLRTGYDDVAETALANVLTVPHSIHFEALAHFYLGKMAGSEGDSDTALKHFTQALALKPLDEKLAAAINQAKDDVSRSGYTKIVPKKLYIMFQQGDMENY